MKFQEGVFLMAIFYFSYTQLVNGQHQPRRGCPPTRCGNVTVEYPFGISSECYSPEHLIFNLTCDENETLLFFNLKVIDIAHSGQLRVNFNVSSTCYDEQENISGGVHVTYTLDPFGVSISNKNKFTLVGCNAFANLRTFSPNRNYSTGCFSFCDSLPSPTTECEGEGCCMSDVSVPLDVSQFLVSPSRYPNLSSVHSFNRCIYAFLVEEGKFNYSSSQDLMNLRNVSEFPVVLEWSIGNQTCEQSRGNTSCGLNSECVNSTRGIGHNCQCLQGFDGNPYSLEGCKDIDECTSNRHNCADPKTCRNKVDGSFSCKCAFTYHLVPTKNSTMMTCTRPEYFRATLIALGTTIGILVFLLAVICTQRRSKYQKVAELRQQFFEQNGGGILVERLTGAGPSNVDVEIFSEEGMKIATNGYDESRILGQGGQGTVYKGILPDNSIVAIKKARLGDSSQVEQFINEVLVLSQINHRNVVKLLGCCLETEVPLLVYEYIPSGTLYDHLYGSLFDSSLTWKHRLRIAIEVAGTLAYLHSSASIPIIHRDIKTANILLDENRTAKVADFGASKLIPMDKEQLSTMVQGTLGYLDPEYYGTGLLNEKSDVYSFGVVLMELISGQKALCFDRPQNSKHIVSYFASATKENRLHEVIDGQVMNEANQGEIYGAARVAVDCTRVTGEERPRMKEVTAQLESLVVIKTKHKWSEQYHQTEDIEKLLGVQVLSLSAQGDTSGGDYDSIKTVARLDIEAGR